MFQNAIKVGIIGSRSRDSEDDFIEAEISFCKLIFALTDKSVLEVYEEVLIISGGAKQGGDRFAEIIARKYSCPILIYHPNHSLGGIAGYLFRNKLIADNSDYLIACIDKESKTAGAISTLNRFKKTHEEGTWIEI